MKERKKKSCDSGPKKWTDKNLLIFTSLYVCLLKTNLSSIQFLIIYRYITNITTPGMEVGGEKWSSL